MLGMFTLVHLIYYEVQAKRVQGNVNIELTVVLL